MVLTFPLSSSGFTVADTGNLAVPTPEFSMAFRPGGGDVNGYGFRLEPRLSNRSKRDCKRRTRVIAAPSRGQRRGSRRGACP